MSFALDDSGMSERALEIAGKVEDFVRNTVAPYERDPRRTAHGPSDEMANELKQKARDAGDINIREEKQLLESGKN